MCIIPKHCYEKLVAVVQKGVNYKALVLESPLRNNVEALTQQNFLKVVIETSQST